MNTYPMNFYKAIGSAKKNGLHISPHYRLMPNKNTNEKYIPIIKTFNELQGYTLGQASEIFTQSPSHSKNASVSVNVNNNTDQKEDIPTEEKV
jgi:hypothetical protein